MLQSQTYVVRKSNNLQNVAVANLRDSKEQQPPECCSRKPTWFERATTSRMLQSQTYVVRKSNNIQNVAVANLCGLKEQQPSECCSWKPSQFKRVTYKAISQSQLTWFIPIMYILICLTTPLVTKQIEDNCKDQLR